MTVVAEGGLSASKIECVFCSVCGKSRAACRKRGAVRCKSSTDVVYRPVAIPTDHAFLKQWFPWIKGKVRKRFKRDHERVPDTTQRVCARLLQKEFTSRWFFKHLSDELITRTEAELMLGHGVPYKEPRVKKGKTLTHRVVYLAFAPESQISPVVGERSSPNSLWRVSDVLRFGGFDGERYFYSMQSHTIDSDHMLRYLGYPPGAYSMLQSLWRQDRILPYELTEHECVRRSAKVNGSGNKALASTCPECQRGLALLRSKKITLDLLNYPAWDGLPWTSEKTGKSYPGDPDIVAHVRKMRWNDSQLAPFLRQWNGGNEIYSKPRFIMRPVDQDGKVHGIDAGLLKYAENIVGNEVINEFKHLSRTDDMSKMVYNQGLSPGVETEAVHDADAEDGAPKVVADFDAVEDFRFVEHRSDISSLIGGASLSDDEREAVSAIDLMEITVRDYAQKAGLPVQRVHRLRTSAIRKLKSAVVSSAVADRAMLEVCERMDCTPEQVLGTSLVGAAVVARAELFARLYTAGMSEEDMASHFNYPRDRVAAAVARGRRRI
jgi:DNA-directed RNA polymerase specialized sigma24 family protein